MVKLPSFLLSPVVEVDLFPSIEVSLSTDLRFEEEEVEYIDWVIMFEFEVDLDLEKRSEFEAPRLGCKVLGVEDPKA